MVGLEHPTFLFRGGDVTTSPSLPRGFVLVLIHIFWISYVLSAHCPSLVASNLYKFS